LSHCLIVQLSRNAILILGLVMSLEDGTQTEVGESEDETEVGEEAKEAGGGEEI